VSDLLEEPLDDEALRPRVLAAAPGSVTLELRPFQVVTLRFPNLARPGAR
jgi:hypothetical protein